MIIVTRHGIFQLTRSLIRNAIDKIVISLTISESLLIMTQVNRKRVRNMEDDGSEFTPLSKRINNLHINGLSRLKDSTNSGDNAEAEWTNGNFTSSPHHSERSQNSSSCDGYSTNQMNFGQEYQPDLNANDNQFYYENNKLLYSLYVERMHRRINLNHI